MLSGDSLPNLLHNFLPNPLPPFDRLGEQGKDVCFGNDGLEDPCTFFPSHDDVEGRKILRPAPA